MSSSRNIAIGIDLGTTHTVAAYLDESGTPVMLRDAQGNCLLPSVLLFDGERVIVGREAIEAVATDGERVAMCAKRDVGERVYHKFLDGRQYPPETLEAWLLDRIRRTTDETIGPVTKAVITVPAYFDEVRRKATQDAAFMAGWEAIDIINEPTAAAIAFGYGQGLLDERGKATCDQRILVYDLGGGTFDVTVMHIRGGKYITLATDGDVRLGGYDWDQRLVDFVAEQFIRTHGTDPREDANALGRLWTQAQQQKERLSEQDSVSIEAKFEGKQMTVDVSREQFESMTRDLLDRTAFTVRITLEAAKLSWDQIDRVLLVGGASRMPMVSRMLASLAGKEPSCEISAHEAVAVGAALRAGQLVMDEGDAKPRFSISNVNSHSLGVVGTELSTGRQRTAVLIPRNTPLPASARRVFKTRKAGQQSILVNIVEGESPTPDDCSEVGSCIVRDLPPDLPEGTPIEVGFHYRDDGRLTIDVVVAGTDNRLHHQLDRPNSLSQEQLDTWRAYISGGQFPDGGETAAITQY